MSIRRLLLTLIAVLAALAVSLGLREFGEIRAKTRAIDWLEQTNQAAMLTQTGAGALARERGFTALLLASPDRPGPEYLAELAHMREAGDAAITRLLEHDMPLERLAPNHPMLRQLMMINEARADLAALRSAVDDSLLGESDSVEAEYWIEAVTRHVELLQQVMGLSMTPLNRDLYANASQPVIKDVMFSLSELLGRERALLSVILARGEPPTAPQLRELRHFRANILRTWQRAGNLLDVSFDDPALHSVVDDFWRTLLVHYEDTRQLIHDHDPQLGPYPVDAHTWFDQATLGIDGALDLSQALGQALARDIAYLERENRISLALLVLVFLAVLITLLLAAQLLRRRVLAPLSELESAARAISAGDLTRTIRVGNDDELGRLARTFEQMRQSLQSTLQQREADMAEMRKLNIAIEQSVSSVIITDAQGRIEYTNPQFTLTTGYAPEEVIGQHVSILKSGHTPSEHYHGLWGTLREGRAWKGEVLNRRKDGELYWEALSISPICGHQGAVTHFISIQHDISERKRIEEQLDFISSYDELTHLPNRMLLAQRFREARARALREGRQIAIVMLGMRRFKRINDSLGHETGDQLLREIANRIVHTTREQDVVTRINGSEFAIMLGGLVRGHDVIDHVRGVLEALNRPAHVDDHTLQLNMHAGVSLMPVDGDTLDQLLACAGIALHQAERDGNERMLLYTRSLDHDAQEKLAMETALRHALENDGLELHYQPKLDLRSGEVVGAEALARWRHPGTGDFVSPDRFIAVAEETGLIHALGDWVIDEACRQSKSWQQAGLPALPVAINLSAMQLQQRTLPDTLRSALERHSRRAADLEIELTESVVMDNPEEAIVALRLLKGLGLRIAIDDFGTGYSSLAYLNRFPVDVLKIDRGFVHGISNDPSAAAISSSVIALAHRMQLRVVAEGVETREQLDFLREQQCDEIQGYLFSRALPAADYAALLASGKRLAAEACKTGRDTS